MVEQVPSVMKSILVLHPERIEENERSFEKKLVWFDPLFGDLKEFKGTKLKYTYIEESFVEVDGKNIPADTATEDEKEEHGIKKVKRLKAEPVTITVKEKNKVIDGDAVEKWFSGFANYNNTSARVSSTASNGVVFDVDDSKRDDIDHFLYSLERNRIKFRIL